MNEQAVAQHYSRGGLEQQILDLLTTIGADLEYLDLDQLAPVDEFHIGGRSATAELVNQLDLRPGLRVLDVGSGLGGTARYLARQHAVEVTGLDLTMEYVQVAASLTRRVGLANLAEFHQGSAAKLPFSDGSFDRACMLHVGMNIADKATLFAEVRRVLVPGGLFGVYDVMRTGPGDIAFPVPWAASAATSFVAEPAYYREVLAKTGLTVQSQRDRRDFALDFFREMRARTAQGGPPVLGLHIVMGPDAPLKIANMVDGLTRAVLAPTEMICLAEPLLPSVG
ncbi:MAG TPA: class I SAM-dependent methyltransferase [Pseudonocardiaceae bacterium]|nr:class I SAM-dependent methyltransferase [Pseudonocardiaceae bacterium]